MYELEGFRPAFDRFWQGLAGAFTALGITGVPKRLDRSLDADELWLHPDLLIAQTCGYPLTHALEGRVKLVATPCYAAPACAGPRYASLIVARADDERRRLEDFRADGRVAINALDSHSGHHALRATLAAHAGGAGGWFKAAIVTGSHVASLDAIRAGEADVAAIDGVLAALLERHLSDCLDGVRVVEVGPAAPGLPLITSVRTDEADLERLRAGLREAVAEPSLERVRRDLLIEDIEVLPLDAYHRILDLERQGAAVLLPDPHPRGYGASERGVCFPPATL